MSESTIRAYRPSDRDAVARICLLTGANGRDASGIFSDDSLVADVFALPYVTYAPDLAWVVEGAGEGTVLGYVIAVADTRAFVAWWRDHWTPGFRQRHPAPGTMRRAYPYTEEALVRDGADPSGMVRALTPDELDAYPAHLHIDLLPAAQRKGLGRRLIDTLRSELAERGVPGVHLRHGPTNHDAAAFYARYGFRPLPSSTPEAPALGIASESALA